MKLNLAANGPTEQRVLEYLQTNASDVLAEKINGGTKTLAGALDYATEQAKSLAGGASCVCVDDATVYGWIIHFFEESHIAEPKTKRPRVAFPSGVAVTPKPKPDKTPETAQLTMFETLLTEGAKA